MNSTSIITALVLAACGYAVGLQHGTDRADLAEASAVEVVVAEYPYAATCSAMLEAAWDVQDAAPIGLPHKP